MRQPTPSKVLRGFKDERMELGVNADIGAASKVGMERREYPIGTGAAVREAEAFSNLFQINYISGSHR